MLTKCADALGEVLYTSAMFFVYYYLFLTFIRLDAGFSLGFHPPTEMSQLVVAAVVIFIIVTGAKAFIVMDNAETGDEPKVTYTPSQRKCI